MCEKCAINIVFASQDSDQVEEAIKDFSGRYLSRTLKTINRAALTLYVLDLNSDVDIDLEDEDRILSIRKSGTT
jgi:hypothetical protein